MNINIFEEATKQKLRFTTKKGQIGVEDLWDLPLEDLDIATREIDGQLEKTSGHSYIRKKNTTDKKLNLRREVLISIINTKQEEEDKRVLAVERKAKRNQLLELISAKENDALGRKSINSLRAELEKLEDEEG